MWETITWSVSDRIGTLTLNRPDHFNALSPTMLREVITQLRQAATDDSLSVLVLTGAGRAFCPGADLAAAEPVAAPQAPLTTRDFQVPLLLHEMPLVTIAAINGACAGAGFGWACACDFRYAVADARFNTAFLDVAVAGDMGLPWTLPRIVGAAKARELSFLPRKFTAEEARQYGLLHGLASDQAALQREVRELATRLGRVSPPALRALKAHYTMAESLSFREFLDLETEAHFGIAASAEFQEAIRALAEGRQAATRKP